MKIKELITPIALCAVAIGICALIILGVQWFTDGIRSDPMEQMPGGTLPPDFYDVPTEGTEEAISTTTGEEVAAPTETEAQPEPTEATKETDETEVTQNTQPPETTAPTEGEAEEIPEPPTAPTQAESGSQPTENPNEIVVDFQDLKDKIGK